MFDFVALRGSNCETWSTIPPQTAAEKNLVAARRRQIMNDLIRIFGHRPRGATKNKSGKPAVRRAK